MMSDLLSAFAPGRVNVIGEHTDYNGGLALPFAIEQGTTVTVGRRRDRRMLVTATDLGEQDSFSVDAPEPATGWRAFARGLVAEFRTEGIELPGAQLTISGDVPRGGGLSSSAAMSVSLGLALQALGGTPDPDRLALARTCSRVENEWVGAQTGLLDQLASLFGAQGHAMLIDFASLELTPVPLRLGDHVLVTLDSGEPHDLSASGYNERRAECAEARERLGVDHISEASFDAVLDLPEPFATRALHVLEENDRVRAAVKALRKEDPVRLGELLTASHASLRDLYEVSTPAAEEAVERLLEAGALGARIVGGGFGGNVLGLMPAKAALPEGAVAVAAGDGARLLGDGSGAFVPG